VKFPLILGACSKNKERKGEEEEKGEMNVNQKLG
jgi:hypothetical protein